jgi:hypothetical protein
MKTVEISSVAEFHAQVERTYSFHPVFRGEPKSTYKLRSKFGRYTVVNPINDIDSETATLDEFKRRSLPYLEHEPGNDWEWLSLLLKDGC